MIISTFFIAYLGMLVTEKYVVPKLGRYTISEEDDMDLEIEVTKREKKGVWLLKIKPLLMYVFVILE